MMQWAMPLASGHEASPVPLCRGGHCVVEDVCFPS